MSSYQNLVEGKCELIAKHPDTEDKLNVTELLRDLYQKVYKIEQRLLKIETPQPEQTDQASQSS